MHSEPTRSTGDGLETVVESADAAEVAIIKSLFESADIPYLTRGEDEFDAFRGAFRGTVFSASGRPVVFLVPVSRAADARALLAPYPAD